MLMRVKWSQKRHSICPGVEQCCARRFLLLDGVSLVEEMQDRACIMKSVPRFMGEEICAGERTREEARAELFILLPRMLLHHPARGGHTPRAKLISRFESFVGDWGSLILASRECSTQAAVVRRRRSCRMLVHMGELSSARQALEGRVGSGLLPHVEHVARSDKETS